MNKESLKRIILEKIGSNSEDSFTEFLQKISENLSEGDVIEIAGVGNFQLKKEPLSRMERKGGGAERTLLIYLPIGGKSESEILTFDVDSSRLDGTEFNESVFDVGIDRPTIISESGTPTEKIFNNIVDLIESSDIKNNYDLLGDLQQEDIPEESAKNLFDLDESVDEKSDEIISDNEDNVTEADINENYLSNVENSDIDNNGIVDDTTTEPNKEENIEINNEKEQGFDVVSSNIESVITDEDVEKSDRELSSVEEVESAEINSAFTIDNSGEENSIVSSEPEVNPFDELDDYIKEDKKDEAQEILDDDTEEIIEEKNEINKKEIEEVSNSKEVDDLVNGEKTSEEKLTKKYSSYSAMRNKSTTWYKNPILIIALFSALIAIVVVVMFWPSNNQNELTDSPGERISLNTSKSILDSNNESTNNNVKDSISSTDKAIEQKLAEIEKMKKSSDLGKDENDTRNVGTVKKKTINSQIYREIKNDQTITNRIYFDGKQYMVQSSSWKSKSIAEREVSKLRKRGFDAFIYKVYIPSKGSTWNRVRIGYFNSKKEAEDFLKNNKI